MVYKKEKKNLSINYLRYIPSIVVLSCYAMRVNGNKNGKNKFEKKYINPDKKRKEKTHYHTLHLSDRIIIDERKKK